MNIRRFSKRVLISTGTAVAVAGLLAGPAAAKSGDIVRQGRCSAHSDWKLKLGPRGSVIESEFEVDSNINGQRWNVRVTDNGALVFSGRKTTIPPSGSFSLSLRSTNRAGTDHFVAVATNPATSEVCRATASV